MLVLVKSGVQSHETISMSTGLPECEEEKLQTRLMLVDLGYTGEEWREALP